MRTNELILYRYMEHEDLSSGHDISDRQCR